MNYVLFLLDRFNGAAFRVIELTALSDSAAIELARAEPWQGDFELWQGDRKVLRSEAYAPFRKKRPKL